MYEPCPSSWPRIIVGLGALNNHVGYVRTLLKEGVQLDPDTFSLMAQVILSRRPQSLSVVLPSVHQLGFEHKTPLDRVIQQAMLFSVGACPAEVGPALRLAYPDQPAGELVVVAMEPLILKKKAPFPHPGNYLNLFSVEHQFGMRILSFCNPKAIVGRDTRIAFLEA